ncbi:enolase C-terminal domain-like protein [Paraburkholderia phytofirmans]|uniref:enolase C-terminal domain-like protein n=1 Tax=Paraburkholderia phytofirmans TaxID=261302 RepID=UPI0038BC8130
MSGFNLTIERVRARAVVVPIARPVRTAVGDVPAAPLVLIDVHTREGIVGSSYLFGYTPFALEPLVTIVEQFGNELVGKAVLPYERMREFHAKLRLLGCQGLAGMVISGLDMAFWDALGKAANMPVVNLLGGRPTPLRAYDSYGMVDLEADGQALLNSCKRGFRGVKIKIGYEELARDYQVVRGVRDLIGADVALMVDYNQSLDPAEAKRRIECLREFDLHWVEEPVPAEDVIGHAEVRRAGHARIQTGENWWFPRGMQQAISAGASDFAMPDIMKIGGVTGWMQAAALAEAASLPLSSHLFVEASAHVLAVSPTFHWLEYLDFAGGILQERLLPVDGMVTARGPGLGMAWNEDAVKEFSI